ncbi:MAG: PQQ-dependent sugar dehydrogenase [Gemmataceae bacterium]|nr:PQQ-dependent sugar dehydrogenase [Gemmataceae bacterium]
MLPELKVINPISVAHEPGTEHVLLVHQLRPWVGPGRVLRVNGAGKNPEVLLDIDRTIYGLAFHPDYLKNGYLFLGSNGPVTKEDKDVPGQRFKPGLAKTTRVSRFTVSRQAPFACDPRSEKIILEWRSNGHNGGDLAFGPDGFLYISSGDGTADSDTDLAGQDLSRLLAKVLRIDVDRPGKGMSYGIPADNPFVKTAGARPETWAYGLRNPWRLHVDSKSGDVWVGNNGQDLWESVYLVQRGANYGWSLVEGSHPFMPKRKQGPTAISEPLINHHHSEARSLTGGIVYRGAKRPELRGAYLYGDWSTGKIWGVRQENGKVAWHELLADSTLQVTGFGTDAQGELLIVDYGGGLYTLEPAPKQANPPKFPTKLSDTGLFVSVKDHKTVPALIPYSVNAPLWSDGADKERFLALPGNLRIDFTAERGWGFPEGAVLVKTFALPMSARGRQRIETRLLTLQQGKWIGYSYEWNDDQTDAILVASAGKDKQFAVVDGTATKRKQVWHYPSRAECLVCHSRAANFVLGPSVLQMNKDHDYGRVTDNQLRTLEHLGVFRVSTHEHLRELRRELGPALGLLGLAPESMLWRLPGTGTLLGEVQDGVDRLDEHLRKEPTYTNHLPMRPERYPRLFDPADARASLNARARSYLHANCAQCHVRAGGGNAAIDLEFGTGREEMRLFGIRPQHQTFDIADAMLVAPGDAEKSVLYQRLIRRGTGQMPPLATSEIDQQAVELLRQWIKNP